MTITTNWEKEILNYSRNFKEIKSKHYEKIVTEYKQLQTNNTLEFSQALVVTTCIIDASWFEFILRIKITHLLLLPEDRWWIEKPTQPPHNNEIRF